MEMRLILVTCPDKPTAESIAADLVESRLAACVNIIGDITSVFEWNSKIETSNEHLLLIKSVEQKIPELEERVLKLHPYDTPEFVSVPLTGVNEKYSGWMRSVLFPAG